MNRTILVCILTLLILVSFCTQDTTLKVSNKNDGLYNDRILEKVFFRNEINNNLTEHETIHITNSTDFITQASSEHWPGNGSRDNPFLITNLSITNQANSGIIIQNIVNLTFQISGCTIRDLKGNGIYLSNVSHCTIDNNYVVENYCTFDNKNIVQIDQGNGIVLNNVTETVVTNNIFAVNSINGIRIKNSTNITVSQNSVYHNEYMGIRLRYSNICKIFDNHIYKNDLYGISILSCDNSVVNNNRFENNKYMGVDVDRSYKINVTRNQVLNTGELAGISLRDCIWGEVYVLHNNISWNENGVAVINCTSNVFSENRIVGNFEYGIQLTYSQHSKLTNNEIDENHMNAIYMYESINSLVSNNTISDNDGVYCKRSRQIVISYNVLKDNNYYGVGFDETSNSTVISNVFLNNNPNYNIETNPESQAYTTRNEGEPNVFFGNYWSDWTSPDENNDGIVDKPYPILGGTQDPKPVISPESTTFQLSQVTIPNPKPTSGFILIVGILGLLFYGILKRKKKQWQ